MTYQTVSHNSIFSRWCMLMINVIYPFSTYSIGLFGSKTSFPKCVQTFKLMTISIVFFSRHDNCY
ncbi:hypothetical protein BpHYR1_024654 [Brachionus plicatilis]|uniref:Uncharacterized protein n=1 Tax=Brachionus plicatilis TaxID=10195 RepID=A0A3M7R0X4_BRAPC|nr:hypothetical protein BpHYR1_024654 [Brachionus plicatilis]